MRHSLKAEEIVAAFELDEFPAKDTVKIAAKGGVIQFGKG